ncbi:(d)CMP kinase [Thermoflexibacter ruber]|uniref:Cytidylate kinase n=1 Tax=Thermoflexibacter ruber TaxID=1003 RepID=A0A1I2A567_9BACT|nr:(d)CMP kinase [Thermoflexibacter ruber]SFE39185.1 cytidylate kinase [Thermoflexibacter ruber]
MKKIIIAIDGYSACGKSSTAKAVASILGYSYIDTGAMYRAVTLYFLQNFVSLTNPNEIENALKEIEIEFRHNPKTQKSDTYLNGINVEQEIRQMTVSDKVSEVSAISQVRRFLVAQQQKMGKKKGIVMDGRDIGTVVFPEAELKIFMTAEMTVRAKRRQDELLEKGELVDLEEIIENLKKRDLIDTSRQDSPLRQAEDAQLIDTTAITFEEQVKQIVAMSKQKLAEE